MKKIFCIFCSTLFCALLFGCGIGHPSGYKVHEWKPDFEKTYVTIEADCILERWYENISYEQYQEMERLFAKDQWQESEYSECDENSAALSFYIEAPENHRERIFLYDDDMAVQRIGSGMTTPEFYQMPAGTCEKLNAYLRQYYQKQHDTVVKLDTFLPDFFAAEYDVNWLHDYGEVRYIQNDEWEISADDMFCPGSPEMSEEVLAVLADRSQWEEIPFDMNLYFGTNQPIPISFQCENLYGDDYYIDFRKLEDGRTHVAVNTYAAFLAPGELYDEIEKIFDHYEDDWEVIPRED